MHSAPLSLCFSAPLVCVSTSHNAHLRFADDSDDEQPHLTSSLAKRRRQHQYVTQKVTTNQLLMCACTGFSCDRTEKVINEIVTVKREPLER